VAMAKTAFTSITGRTAGHTLDGGHLYCSALEKAPAGSRLHAVGDEGISMREIAQSIGDHLNLPTASVSDDWPASGTFRLPRNADRTGQSNLDGNDPADSRMRTGEPRAA